MTGGSGADRFVNNTSSWGFHLITDFESGVDQLRLNGAALGWTRGEGRLASDELAIGLANQPHAQFVLQYNEAQDETLLLYDSNGNQPGGGYTGVIRFQGDIMLQASDIFIL